MKKLNIHEIVDILIGDTSSHGESNRDAISLENLKVKAALVHKLVADLRYTARNRDCSMEYISNFILSKWEESTRWRKVEEELPEDNRDVLGRGKSEKIVVVFYSNVDKCFLSNTTYDVLSITDWKPIH